MLAVASVVLNRVRHAAFPDDVCGVVTQGGETPPCQFSWWCDGRSDRPREGRAGGPAAAGAGEALEKRIDTTDGALFYHNPRLAAWWSEPAQPPVRIGRHVFYR